MSRALLVALALLVAPGCATVCGSLSGTAKELCEKVNKPEAPPVEAGVTITPGVSDCVESALPASLQIDITGKQPGTAEREEVTLWSFAAGGDFKGGNPLPPTFSARCNDSRPTWAKLKVYRDGHTGQAEKEQKLDMAWDPSQTYRLRLDVAQGSVTWTATRLGDGVVASARVEAATPARAVLCWGDPESRKAAEGATVTNVVRTAP